MGGVWRAEGTVEGKVDSPSDLFASVRLKPLTRTTRLVSRSADPQTPDVATGCRVLRSTLAANSNALRAVRGVVKAARSTLIAPCRVASSKSPASAATIPCWSRSVNRGALGRPFGLPD
jgi:hypothetical protein